MKFTPLCLESLNGGGTGFLQLEDREPWFEKEPGFFFGAMFVSYGLGVAEALITYFICMPFFEETFDLRIIPIIGVVILSLTLVNIKLSRIIWIYMFKDYSV